MKKKVFNLKLNDFDFSNPEHKKYYNKHLFTEVAPKYDFLTKVLSFGRDNAWKKKLIKNLPHLRSSLCIDIACGTGDVTSALAKKYSDGHIIGMDFNQDMINRANELHKIKNIRYMIADMCNIGCKDGSFDIVTGGYALRNAPDLDKALSEIYRIMKFGSVAAFLDFSKTPIHLLQKIELFLLKLWGSLWGTILHGNPEVYSYIAESLKVFPDRLAFKKLLIERGFKNTRTKMLFFGFLQLLIFEK